MTSKIIRKTLEEAQHVQNAEIDFSDKNLIHLDEMPRLWTMKNVTRLTLSHNKITEIPAALVKALKLPFSTFPLTFTRAHVKFLTLSHSLVMIPM